MERLNEDDVSRQLREHDRFEIAREHAPEGQRAVPRHNAMPHGRYG
jgi:hypothetical protein